MRKIISVTVIIVLIIIGAYLYFNGTSDDDIKEHQAENQSENPPLEKDEKEKLQTTLEDIFHLAEEGKIPSSDIVVGETGTDEIYEEWGDTDKKTEVEGITYLEYPEQSATIGVKDDIVVDVRSSTEDVKQINLDGIKAY